LLGSSSLFADRLGAMDRGKGGGAIGTVVRYTIYDFRRSDIVLLFERRGKFLWTKAHSSAFIVIYYFLSAQCLCVFILSTNL